MTREMLKQYRDILEEYRDLKRRIHELRSVMLSVGSPPLGTPSGGNTHGSAIERVTERYQELLRLYEAKANEALRATADIEHFASGLPPKERMVVRLYYLDGLCWFKVAAKMHYSERQVLRYHDAALSRIR